jgi:hypothetical protein
MRFEEVEKVFEGEEVEKVPLPLLEVRVGPHGGDRHFHRPVKGVFVEAGCFMGNTADDHRVNGRATPATAAVSTTMGIRVILARTVRRRGTWE